MAAGRKECTMTSGFVVLPLVFRVFVAVWRSFEIDSTCQRSVHNLRGAVARKPPCSLPPSPPSPSGGVGTSTSARAPSSRRSTASRRSALLRQACVLSWLSGTIYTVQYYVQCRIVLALEFRVAQNVFGVRRRRSSRKHRTLIGIS